MAKLSKRRQLTGCLRRGPKRNHSSYRRAMHLSHADVGYRHYLQRCIVRSGNAVCSALLAISPLVILSVLAHNTNVVNPAVPNAALAFNYLLSIQHLKYAVNQTRFARWFLLDFKYHDIPPEEEADHMPTRMPRQNIIFNSWTNQECYDFTSFTKPQLLRIYNQFGLDQLAAHNNGFIRVFTGHEFHRFHPEEIFLFMMTKCKTGHSNKELCDLIFGGHASRWSYGYPWILEYLDIRYQRTLSHEKLRDFVDEFPQFFDAIQKCIQRTTTHHFTDNTAEDRIGLNFLPFDIFSFIDCSIDRINRPFSGPDGDYLGAPRKENYYDAQRSVYTGYKKCHGIKVETVMLPNGISTVYGPMSARPQDLHVLHMSGLDQFLFEIQQGKNHIYSALGDGIYNANGLRCKCTLFYV